MSTEWINDLKQQLAKYTSKINKSLDGEKSGAPNITKVNLMMPNLCMTNSTAGVSYNSPRIDQQWHDEDEIHGIILGGHDLQGMNRFSMGAYED